VRHGASLPTVVRRSGAKPLTLMLENNELPAGSSDIRKRPVNTAFRAVVVLTHS
jgi:hypothetical protein